MSADRRAGFTLIEMLVAVAVLALGMTGVMQLFSSGLRGINAAEETAAATARARSLLDAAGVESRLAPGRQEGEDGNGLRWAVSVQPWPGAEAAWIEVWDVQVTVSAPGGRAVSLRSLRQGAVRR